MNSPRTRRAFTLIELLVVVAIIALLIAILLPSLGKARKMAKTSTCLANVRGMGMAAQMYVADNSKYVPWYSTYGQNYWTTLLIPYGQGAKLRICPEATNVGTLDQEDPPKGANATTSWYNKGYAGTDPGTGLGYICSYTPNAFCELPATTESGYDGADLSWYWNFPYIRSTTQIPVFADGTWVDAWPHVNVRAPASVISPNTNDPSAKHMGRFTLDRHSKAINVAFLDGHAETVKLPKLYTLLWNAKVGTTLDPVPNPLPTMPNN